MVEEKLEEAHNSQKDNFLSFWKNLQNLWYNFKLYLIFQRGESMRKILIALSLCASTALLANDANYHWEFTPTVGGVLPEGNTGLDEGFTFGLRIAKNIEDGYWIDQVELGYDRIEDINFDKQPGDTSIDVYHLNAVKDIWNITNDLKLYGLVGAGYMDFNDRINGKNRDTGFGQYGLGLKYYITDNFATKLEVRDAITFDHGNHYMFYSLGFAVDFGARSSNAPVAAATIGDSDGDGVPDNLDRCPGTPAGVVVDEYGCEKVIKFDSIHFAFDSAELSPAASAKLNEVANYLEGNDNYSVLVEGHTDSVGSDAYNQKLSERRAASVKKGLVSEGIAADRIDTAGYGESRPVADNKTAEGRAENRRVETKFRK